ncbi:MAG: hypothetical protein MSIBF_05340 [Candidatus Altiarchaeales archaeon IMC4]|nr:MAG: hypothetical protein MSIBF_05340 [Candidatus Altiarchaeales archaeon IMC4]
MTSKKYRIKINAIGYDYDKNIKIFSVGSVEVGKNGDVYIIHDSRHEFQCHTSRHASGKVHWTSNDERFCKKIRDGLPIKDFKGLEFLETHSFGLDMLPGHFNDYSMSKYDGIFTIDMRAYKNSAFNLFIYMLTDEGYSQLFDNLKKFKKRQLTIFLDSHPMIALVAVDVKELFETGGAGDKTHTE